MDKKTARELMAGFCRVCNNCDGRACAGEVPGMGGKGSGASFKANYDSLREYKLNMKVLHNEKQIDTSTVIFGEKIDLPVMAAPIGGVKYNMSEKISEKEYLKSVVAGCNAAGTIACGGDGVPDYVLETDIEVNNNQDGRVLPFLKPWDNKLLAERLGKLEKETDIKTVGIDVDSIGLSTIDMMGKEIIPRTADELMKVLNDYRFNYILKGIMSGEEAKEAVKAGIDGIVVSNHGGRVLDHTPGTAEVLAPIAEEVGNEITVMVDGGIRTGIDVLKMLALGADAVMIGRPVAIAAFSDLKNGVEDYMENIKNELAEAMLLTGCKNVNQINSEIIYN